VLRIAAGFGRNVACRSRYRAGGSVSSSTVELVAHPFYERWLSFCHGVGGPRLLLRPSVDKHPTPCPDPVVYTGGTQTMSRYSSNKAPKEKTPGRRPRAGSPRNTRTTCER
jgi:hypothetical protein